MLEPRPLKLAVIRCVRVPADHNLAEGLKPFQEASRSLQSTMGKADVSSPMNIAFGSQIDLEVC
jgi:hypothetical protein